MRGVTLEGKFEFALLWGDEASGAGQVNRDNRKVRTCEVGRRDGGETGSEI